MSNMEDKAVKMETECGDSDFAASHQYAATIETMPSTAAFSVSVGNKSDNIVVDEPKNVSATVPPSPVFEFGGGRNRNAKRGKIKGLPGKQFTPVQSQSDGGGENMQTFRSLKLDDFDCLMFEPCQSAQSTPKTSRISFNSERDTSEKFLYPLANASIKKPQRLLNVDQLINCALLLETSDASRSHVDSPSHIVVSGVIKDQVQPQLRLDCETKACKPSVSEENATMVSFNQLYNDNKQQASSVMLHEQGTNEGCLFTGDDENMTSGFKTGSGKSIRIGAASLRNSALLFSNASTEEEHNFGDGGVEKNMTSGFKTSSGKPISVGAASLRSSALLFSDIPTEEKQNFGVGDGDGDKTIISGFETSAGKAIKIDNASLKNSAHIFSDISMEEKQNFGGGSDDKTMISGFKTSAGKAIKIDNAALRNSARVFSDISTEENPNFSGGDGNKTVISGFKTSAGKAIKVDNASLRNSASIFSDISIESDSKVNCRIDRDETTIATKPVAASGFRTSSGKTFGVNAEALQISERLFSDISTEEEPIFGSGSRNKITSGFTTSSGRTISVKDSSLQMSSHLFSNVLNEAEPTCANSFKTAADNIVDVGVESSEKFDHLLADFVASTSSEINQPNKCESSHEVQNQSFELSREITESTSAFLYDISHDQSSNSFFAPNKNGANVTADAKPLAVGDTVGSDVEDKIRNGDDIGDQSRSCSPVFNSNYIKSNLKSSTRRSRASRPSLNVTFGNKTPVPVISDEQSPVDVASINQACVELETLKMNFSCKSYKRKSNTANESGLQAGVKKYRNDVQDQAVSQNQTTAHQYGDILNKPKQLCLPTKGYLSTLISGSNGKADGRISLSHLARYEKPKLYSFEEYVKFGLLPDVIHLNSQNAPHFIFTSQFFSSQQLKSDGENCTSTKLFGDEVPMLFNDENEVTFEEIVAGFLASPGVDPKLVSRKWLANHYRWIVWKLASLERCFPKSLGRRYLALDNVLFQLKFKYELEIDCCVRSALKRILEGDDSPASPLILCVASIIKEVDSFSEYKIELTDGWYSIFSQPDPQIDHLISNKKIRVGDKLIITGAELIGLGEPCDPLQVCENVRIKFSANSSRRVRWDTRLGFYNGRLGPINRIQTILPKGGLISHLTATVARVYPLVFLEKHDNAAAFISADVSAASTPTTAANSNVTWSRLHNEKVEMRKTMAFENDRQNFIESILSQVTNQVLSENATTDADSAADSEKLRDIIQQRVQSRLPVKFSKNRNVSRLLKLRLVDAQDVKNKPSAVLTIWNPCDDVANFFKEGRSYRFFNINTNGIRDGELQLCSTRSSKYDRDQYCDNSNDCWFARRVCSIDDFPQPGKDEKSCSLDEVDVTGIIIRIEPETKRAEMRTPLQSADCSQSFNIYLADLEQRFIALSFRIDPQNFDFGDSIESGKIVAGQNLQWKKGWLCWKIPILYVSERSSFVQSTNIESLRHSIDQIRGNFQSRKLETFVAECEEKLKNMVDSSAETSASTDNAAAACENVNQDGVDASTSTATVVAENVHQIAPPSNESDSCNFTGLGVGNQSTFNNSDIRSKYERLQNYGRPPALSPIVLTSQSKTRSRLPLSISKRSSTNSK